MLIQLEFHYCAANSIRISLLLYGFSKKINKKDVYIKKRNALFRSQKMKNKKNEKIRKN